jgi:hypothetical protein
MTDQRQLLEFETNMRDISASTEDIRAVQLKTNYLYVALKDKQQSLSKGGDTRLGHLNDFDEVNGAIR